MFTKKLRMITKNDIIQKWKEKFLSTLPNSQQCEHIATVTLYGFGRTKKLFPCDKPKKHNIGS